MSFYTLLKKKLNGSGCFYYTNKEVVIVLYISGVWIGGYLHIVAVSPM